MSSLYFESGLTEHSAKEARPCLDLHHYKIDCRNFSGVFKCVKYFQVFSNIPNIFRCFQIFQMFSDAFKYSKYFQVLDQQPKLGAAWMETVNPEFLLLRWHQIFVPFDQTEYLWLLILLRSNICAFWFWSEQIFVAFDHTKYLWLSILIQKQKPHVGFFFWTSIDLFFFFFSDVPDGPDTLKPKATEKRVGEFSGNDFMRQHNINRVQGRNEFQKWANSNLTPDPYIYVSPACISQVIGKRGLSLTFSQKHSLTFSLTFLRWWEGGWKARAVSHLQPRPPAPALWLWCQVMLNTDTDTDTDTEHSGYGARWFLNTDLEADIYQHDNSGTVVTEMLPVITLSLWGELSVRPWAGDNSITKTLSRG